jgi:predicted permease
MNLLRKLLRRNAQDADRADEIESHVALATEHYIKQGMTPDAARREARLRFGNPRATRETINDLNRLPIWDAVRLDFRYAARVLRKSPAFTLTVVGTLALVIAASTAVFSVADRVLLRPLAYPHPEQLAIPFVRSQGPNGSGREGAIDGTMWIAIRDRITSADSAAFVGGDGGVNLNVGDQAKFVHQQRVGAGYFRVVGLPPAYGREFSADEDRPGGPNVAILSDGLWRRLFNADPGAIGRSVILRGDRYEIVGVMPPNVRGAFDEDIDVWTPLRPSTAGEGANTNYQCVMRVKPGVTLDHLNADLHALGSRELFASLGSMRENNKDEYWLSAQSMQDEATADSRDVLTLLGAAAGLVLLIACVNIASLFLARGSARVREIATRMALGSGRGLVVRQLMMESLLVAAAGGVAGIGLGALALQGLKSLSHGTFDSWQHASIDARVIVMMGAFSLATSVIFGLVPAWQASRIDVQRGLIDGGSRGIAGGARHWVRRSLVVVQVALGVVLLVAAGLLIRTFAGLYRLNPGFDVNGVTTASVSLQDARYTDPVAINQLFDRSVAALAATPGVSSAAVTLELPYTRLLNMGVQFSDGALNGSGRMANLSYVTAGFTNTFGIRLVAGRSLAETDRADSVPVVLVNEAFANLYSKDVPVVGRRVKVAGAEREIVGVIGNVQQRQSFKTAGVVPGPITTLPAVFAPASQLSAPMFKLVHQWFRPVWSVRSSGVDVAQAIRSAIVFVDPRLPVVEVRTMAQVRGESLAIQRLMMTLVGIIAAAALLLSAMGLYGLIAHGIGERRREFGIRLALGATRAQTIRAASMTGIVLALIGGLAGAVLSIPASQLVQSLLWGVKTADAATYAGVIAFLLLVAGVASLTPALKLLRLDPAKTLRE